MNNNLKHLGFKNGIYVLTRDVEDKDKSFTKALEIAEQYQLKIKLRETLNEFKKPIIIITTHNSRYLDKRFKYACDQAKLPIEEKL